MAEPNPNLLDYMMDAGEKLGFGIRIFQLLGRVPTIDEFVAVTKGKITITPVVVRTSLPGAALPFAPTFIYSATKKEGLYSFCGTLTYHQRLERLSENRLNGLNASDYGSGLERIANTRAKSLAFAHKREVVVDMGHFYAKD